MEPLIIECALNEQVTRQQNPSVPIAPDELVADALAAAEAGASIVHFHARDSQTGDLLHPGTEFYRDVMRQIRRECSDLLLYPTYGASPTPQERFSHLVALAEDPEIRLDFATIDPGAVNYADFDPEARELGWDFVLSVSHAEVRYFFDRCAEHGIQYSYTVRELGHVRHVLAYRAMGWVSGPLLFKVTMSANHAWGVAPSPEGLRLLTAAIIPQDVPYRWMTYVEGDRHAELSRHAVEQGGHVRTGVGDNPLFEGELLTNAEQVSRVVEMARAVGREIADPAQTRQLLATPPPPLPLTDVA
ncbi:MAG: 3-keto-5-aminohexanoate cleavage protein [Myxococcota bacterium]|nr:3-keto-5-aminohexanoate cleavage protein [Myxococcota bacterium]